VAFRFALLCPRMFIHFNQKSCDATRDIYIYIDPFVSIHFLINVFLNLNHEATQMVTIAVHLQQMKRDVIYVDNFTYISATDRAVDVSIREVSFTTMPQKLESKTHIY
jgi:hypothetical protein